jgi:putative nucleotidyltransferase with HDIG domain
VNAFFRAGIYVGLTNVVTILVFRLPSGTTDSIGMLTLIVVGLVNGAVAASLTLAIFFVVGNLLDITTALKLLELSQPSHPLLRELLLKAPGTYHHTLLVTSLAEQAAESIGANALLTRVGAFYHDIGKISRPRFFTENQMDGVNPHDQLDPYTSAAILLDHVQAGIELAKRYQLPSRVRAFIPEHQGDSSVSFMYQRAVKLAGGDATQVDASRFRYVGPKPQSRETALVMLADITESMVRSKRPGSVDELEELVNRAIKIRMDQGQLDECDLTLRDLRIIGRSFTDTLKGLYHTRVEYPESVPLRSPVPKELVPVAKPSGAAMEEQAAVDAQESDSAFAQAFSPSGTASRARELPREE